VPSVEEFLGVQRDSRVAYAAGHIWELRDVMTEAEQNAVLSANRRAYTPQRTMLPDGSIDARVQPDDPIALPAWAFRIVFDVALLALEHGDAPKLRRGDPRWYERYRRSLIHWHRYVLVQRAIDAGFKQADSKQQPRTAFEFVSDNLKGTSFGASAKAMEISFSRVRDDLARGEAWRYYRSRSFVLYQQLLGPDADFVVVVPGLHGETAGS